MDRNQLDLVYKQHSKILYFHFNVYVLSQLFCPLLQRGQLPHERFVSFIVDSFSERTWANSLLLD